MEPYSDRNILKKSTRTSNRCNVINHIKVIPSRGLDFSGFIHYLIISLIYNTCWQLEMLELFSKRAFRSVLPKGRFPFA